MQGSGSANTRADRSSGGRHRNPLTGRKPWNRATPPSLLRSAWGGWQHRAVSYNGHLVRDKWNRPRPLCLRTAWCARRVSLSWTTRPDWDEERDRSAKDGECRLRSSIEPSGWGPRGARRPGSPGPDTKLRIDMGRPGCCEPDLESRLDTARHPGPEEGQPLVESRLGAAIELSLDLPLHGPPLPVEPSSCSPAGSMA
jgi:hypothetical protein